MPTPSVATGKPLPTIVKAKALTSTSKYPASTRSGSAAGAAHPGAKALAKKAVAGRVGELRRPHTSIAVMRAKPKAIAAVDEVDGIVFRANFHRVEVIW